MKAPGTATPRNLDAILADAVKLIDPPKASVEAFRAQLTACIIAARRTHEETANLPPPGEMRDLAAAYLEKLLAVKKAANAMRSSSDFIAALEQEIIRAETLTCLVVPSGRPPPNAVAHAAVVMARSLIDPNPDHHPENRGKDWPPIDCPWRRRARLTRGGAWLTLAALIYEGATGVCGRDMMEDCRKVDEQQPRYIVRLRFQAPS